MDHLTSIPTTVSLDQISTLGFALVHDTLCTNPLFVLVPYLQTQLGALTALVLVLWLSSSSQHWLPSLLPTTLLITTLKTGSTEDVVSAPAAAADLGGWTD